MMLLYTSHLIVLILEALLPFSQAILFVNHRKDLVPHTCNPQLPLELPWD
jgi:hypothetical protein